MKRIFRVIALGVVLITSQANAQDTTETIVTTGMGSTIESAIQNAARNALTQAVGQFVDTETQISKRTEIRDGVREITKDMSENISATSNGTIQEVVVLEQQNNDGIFEVDAAVTVRISDLERAMEGRLSVKADVSNVFAQVARANNNNLDDKAEILSRILNEVVGSEFLDVSVGEPQTLTAYLAENNIDDLEGKAGGYLSFLQGRYSSVVDDLIELYAQNNYTILVVPVDIGFTDSAIKTWKKTIRELAANEVKFAWNEFDFDPSSGLVVNRSGFLFQARGNINNWRNSLKKDVQIGSLPICFVTLNVGNTCFIIDGIGKTAAEKYLGSDFYPWLRSARPSVFSNHELELSVVDQKGFPVASGAIIGNSGGVVREMSEFLQVPNAKFQFGRNLPGQIFPMTPYSGLIASNSNVIPNIHLFEKRRIHVGLMLTADQLDRAASVEAKIIEGSIK